MTDQEKRNLLDEVLKVILEQRNPSNLNYKPTEKIAEAVRSHFKIYN